MTFAGVRTRSCAVRPLSPAGTGRGAHPLRTFALPTLTGEDKKLSGIGSSSSGWPDHVFAEVAQKSVQVCLQVVAGRRGADLHGGVWLQ